MQVIRFHQSSYFPKDFATTEKICFQDLDCVYCTSDKFDPHKDTILLTDTHFKLEYLEKFNTNAVKLMIHTNSGYDNLQRLAHAPPSYPIILAPHLRRDAVVEYYLKCLFHHLSAPPFNNNWDPQRAYKRSLAKKKVLIIGLGQIGMKLANCLEQLNYEVFKIDAFKSQFIDHPKNFSQLSEMDYIFICASLNPSSYELINDDFFKNLKPHIVFFNASRGEIIAEKSLLAFCESNPLSRFYLDVFQQEPWSKTNTFPNIFKTSHIAGVYDELATHTIDFQIHVTNDFFKLSPSDFNHKYKNQLLQNRRHQNYWI